MYYFIYLIVLVASAYYTGCLLSFFFITDEERRPPSIGVRKVASVPFNSEGGFIDGTWCIPDTSRIMLRGKEYMSNKRKINCDKESIFEPVDLSIYAEDSGRRKMSNVAINIPDIRNLLESQQDTWFLIITWILPAEPHLSVVMIFRRRLKRSDTAADKLLTDFIKGTNSFKKERFKFIPHIQRCPAIVRKGITLFGGERPTLLCKKIASKFFNGSNYLEIDINISSSSSARGLSSLILPAMNSMSILFAFTLEGRNDDELPEELLGAISVTNVDFARIVSKYVE